MKTHDISKLNQNSSELKKAGVTSIFELELEHKKIKLGMSKLTNKQQNLIKSVSGDTL